MPHAVSDVGSVRFVARQPIFDPDRRLVGYELLYRPDADAQCAPRDLAPADMTRATMVGSILDIGLDQLTGPSPAWIKVPTELLVDGSVDVLDPARVVIEILESVLISEAALDACRALRARGFTLALDDYRGAPEQDPLLQLVQIVKLDVLGVPDDVLRTRVEQLRSHRVKLVAGRVESKEQFLACCVLGFHYFQGYYFRRPEMVGRRVLPVGLARVARLMQMAADAQTTDQRIEDELRSDPGLSVKLLRIVNNAATGHRGVSSIRHAVQLAGRRALQQWLALVLVSGAPVANDVDREGLRSSLERGRLCELLAHVTGRRSQADALFLVGLLACLDLVLDLPVEMLVSQLGVSDEVGAALRGDPGPHTPILHLARAYADADWATVTRIGRSLGVLVPLPALYLEASSWARTVLASA